MSRNNGPVIPAHVEHGTHARAEAGVVRMDYDIVLKPEDFERLRHGRICPKCWEPQSEAFPEVCELSVGGKPICGFPIRSRLGEWLSQMMQGETWLGPRTSIDDNEAMLQEDNERAKFERKRGIVRRPSGLVLPEDFKVK